MRRKRGTFPCSIIAVALILNCRIAFAQQDQYSANSIMPGCREEAALVPFSNPSDDRNDLASFCLGIIVGLSYSGRIDSTFCMPVGVTREQAVRVVVQYIDGQPARTNLAYNVSRDHWALTRLIALRTSRIWRAQKLKPSLSSTL